MLDGRCSHFAVLVFYRELVSILVKLPGGLSLGALNCDPSPDEAVVFRRLLPELVRVNLLAAYSRGTEWSLQILVRSGLA